MYAAGPGTSSSPDLSPAAAAAAGGVQQPSKATIKVSALPPLSQSKLLLAHVGKSCLLHRSCCWLRLHKLLTAQALLLAQGAPAAVCNRLSLLAQIAAACTG